MNTEAKKFAILIPALEPDKRLLAYLEELIYRGFSNIVVVNDGSDESYDPLFQEIAKKTGCTVLKHEKNKGKGRALKTGYKYILEHFSDCMGVITVDSDGQHLAEDVEQVAEAVKRHAGKMVLGERDFKGTYVPVKSRVGNRSTSALFFILYGRWLKDTQTGLRGMNLSFLNKMMEIPGERFEYETQVLITCIKEGILIHTVPVRTVYKDNNRSTHYRPVKDSIRICKILFGSYFRRNKQEKYTFGREHQ